MQDNQSQPVSQNPYMASSNPYMNNEPAQNNYTEKLNTKNDVEYNNENISPEQINKMMRMGFIRKVYGILAFQLAITVGLTSLAFIDGVASFLQTNMYLFWIALALNIIILIPLVCFQSVARTVPINYILLTLWTMCESYMLATAVSFYDPKVVMLAALGTLAITISLTIYAFTTKTDFTYCGSFLFAMLCILLVWVIFVIIFPSSILNSLYCVCGLLVYSLYLIYDTQLISGQFGRKYQIDDYIFAALNIYLDIIQLFLYLLRLFGGRR